MSKVNIDWDAGTASVDGKVYTFGELVDMAAANDAFRGTHLDEEAMARFWRVAKNAQKLKSLCDEISEVSIEPPVDHGANGWIVMVLPMAARFYTETMEVFRDMCTCSEDVIISSTRPDGTITITFSVRNIWTK